MKMAPIDSEGVALEEEVCHYGWALRFQKLKAPAFLLPTDPEGELCVLFSSPCLPVCHYSCCDDNVVNSEL